MSSSKTSTIILDADKPRLPLSHYLPELEKIREQGTDLILVAGQAVNFRADRYQDKDPELLEFVPFVSKDVDLFGAFDDLYIIPKVLDGELKRFRDLRTPVMGVFTTNSDPSLMFELLRGVYGPVSTEKIRNRALDIGQVKIIDPVSLLISKCHNAAGIEQEKRQDVKHVQMMVKVSRCYFDQGVRAVGEKMTPRQFINECKYLLEFADNHIFQKGLSMAGSSVRNCFPVDEIQKAGDTHESLGRFFDNTLMPTIQ